ncbi:Glucuronide permease [Gammaproteobacteria bacterium MOLA455]|nr:Glucuronide permease [Gammaproteobacteria bacterium MOLA455]
MIHRANKQTVLTRGLNNWQVLAFSAPSVGLMFLLGPMSIVQGVYAKYFGIPLTTLAGVLLLCRLFDVFSDPLMGYFSDRYKARTGTRKPFVLVGGLLLLVCSYFLFIPPNDVSTTYITFWMISFYAASTLSSIPTYAWGGEMSTYPEERTLIFSVQAFAGKIGFLLFYLVPFLPLFTTTEMTPETLKASVIIAAVLMLPGLYVALRYAPVGSPSRENKIEKKKKASVSFLEIISAFKRNKPFQVFVVAYMCVGLGMGMYFGLFFIFVDSYLGRGEDYAKLVSLSMVAGLISVPLAYKAITLVGKKWAWGLSLLLMVLSIVYTGQLRPEEDVFLSLLTLKIVLTVGTAILPVITMPLLNESIDYGLLSNRAERRGLYFSIYSLLTKFEMALGLALGLAIAGWLGFDATETNHGEASGFAIRMAMSWIPCVFMCLGFFFIWRLPIDERRAGIIARRLAARDLRESTQ